MKAQELRGGAALVIAALMAQGITRVYGSAFIERGYEDLAGDLRKLGAVISKKKQKGETVRTKRRTEKAKKKSDLDSAGRAGAWSGGDFWAVSGAETGNFRK